MRRKYQHRHRRQGRCRRTLSNAFRPCYCHSPPRKSCADSGSHSDTHPNTHTYANANANADTHSHPHACGTAVP